MSEDVKAIIEKAERSSDPDVRLKAAKYRAFVEAGRTLDAAKVALAAEENWFRSRRVDLENEIAVQNRGAQPIRDQANEAIAAAQARIDAVDARVAEARAVLAKELAEHETRIEGLRQAVVAAEGVDARVNAELSK